MGFCFVRSVKVGRAGIECPAALWSAGEEEYALKRSTARVKRRGQIHLVDRCLLVFMAVLLAQSAYSLFSAGGSGAETDGIDIIVRTSAAAIFGYFLSANYCHDPGPAQRALTDPGSRLQVLTASAIGIFCLLTLLAYRVMLLREPELAAAGSATATVAQFRDFVSGCVGYLIGCPSGKTDQNEQ